MSERERDEPPDPRAGATTAAATASGASARRKRAAWARRLAGHARSVPKWARWSGGALALLLTASLLYFALRPAPGWTLVVNGAPTGSNVFVDDVRRGVTSDDGTVRVSRLRPGNRVLVVAYNGQRDSQGVSGEDGETKEVSAKLAAAAGARLPEEIEYGGAMVLVAAGEFVMGADDREPNERPAHRVTLPDYYIDKYEVTNAQYKKFCEETGHPLPLDPYWTKERLGTEDYFNAFPDLPVIGVSWDDATVYARWAAKRLPTEEEWEKAASWGRGAKQKRRWPWGDVFASGRANVGTSSPARVTEFSSGASAYGALNMAGNLSEWVESHYQPYEGNQGDGLIRKKGYNVSYGTQYRVTRGGSFRGGPDEVRTTRRDAELPASRTQPNDVVNRISWLIGFRCAVSADDPQLQKHLSERGQ